MANGHYPLSNGKNANLFVGIASTVITAVLVWVGVTVQHNAVSIAEMNQHMIYVVDKIDTVEDKVEVIDSKVLMLERDKYIGNKTWQKVPPRTN